MSQTRKANASFEYLPDTGEVTAKVVGSPVVGSRFVKIVAGGVGNQPAVQHAGAGERAYGVSHVDCIAGQTVGVHKGNKTVGVLATGVAITAGAPIAAAANGMAVLAAGSAVVLGTANADTAANGICPVSLTGM